MTHSRTLFTPLITTLVAISVGLHTAGALEARGAKQYGVLPTRFFTVIGPFVSAHLALQAGSQKPKSDDPLPEGKGKDVVMPSAAGATP
jgi:hypothetical protein